MPLEVGWLLFPVFPPPLPLLLVVLLEAGWLFPPLLGAEELLPLGPGWMLFPLLAAAPLPLFPWLEVLPPLPEFPAEFPPDLSELVSFSSRRPKAWGPAREDRARVSGH